MGDIAFFPVFCKRSVTVTLVICLAIVTSCFFNFSATGNWGTGSFAFRNADLDYNSVDSKIQEDSETDVVILYPPRPNHPSKLYTCGYGNEFVNLALNLFPEFLEIIPLDANSILQAEDVLVYGMFGKCLGLKMEIFRERYIGTNFQGKVIWVNGERNITMLEDSRSSNHEYQIGAPINDDSHANTIRVFYMAIVAGALPKEQQKMLFDPLQKPRNTGRHNAVIYINGNCVPFRQKAARKISSLVPIHFGGRCKVNVTNGQVVSVPKRGNYTDNWAIYRDYKYCLCMENANSRQYISEKIIMAFLGGCIPIYYGTPEVLEVFNAKAFIYYNIDDPVPALKEIRHLNRHPGAYQRKQEQPILRNGSRTVEDFFSLADSIGRGQLKGRIRSMLGFAL
jgi:hypothetical protein